MQINRRGHTYIYKYICTHTHTCTHNTYKYPIKVPHEPSCNQSITHNAPNYSICKTHNPSPIPPTAHARKQTHLPERGRQNRPIRGMINTRPSKHAACNAAIKTRHTNSNYTKESSNAHQTRPTPRPQTAFAWLARMTPARTSRDIKEPSLLIVWWFGIYLLIYFVALFPNQQLMTISNIRAKISSGIKEWSTRV